MANDDDHQQLSDCDEVVVAQPSVVTDRAAPQPVQQPGATPSRPPLPNTMDFKINFGDSAGFQTRGAKKKKAAAKFDPWGDDENKAEDNGSANGGAGGGDGSTGGGGNGAGSGGGGDDNNGGNGDDDDWGFSTGKKAKKKTKKQQQQEEEEQRRKEEEEAAAANKPDPLSWADEANEAANDDWSLSWGTGKKTEKKKKKVCSLSPRFRVLLIANTMFSGC